MTLIKPSNALRHVYCRGEGPGEASDEGKSAAQIKKKVLALRDSGIAPADLDQADKDFLLQAWAQIPDYIQGFEEKKAAGAYKFCTDDHDFCDAASIDRFIVGQVLSFKVDILLAQGDIDRNNDFDKNGRDFKKRLRDKLNLETIVALTPDQLVDLAQLYQVSTTSNASYRSVQFATATPAELPLTQQTELAELEEAVANAERALSMHRDSLATRQAQMLDEVKARKRGLAPDLKATAEAHAQAFSEALKALQPPA